MPACMQSRTRTSRRSTLTASPTADGDDGPGCRLPHDWLPAAGLRTLRARPAEWAPSHRLERPSRASQTSPLPPLITCCSSAGARVIGTSLSLMDPTGLVIGAHSALGCGKRRTSASDGNVARHAVALPSRGRARPARWSSSVTTAPRRRSARSRSHSGNSRTAGHHLARPGRSDAFGIEICRDRRERLAGLALGRDPFAHLGWQRHGAPEAHTGSTLGRECLARALPDQPSLEPREHRQHVGDHRLPARRRRVHGTVERDQPGFVALAMIPVKSIIERESRSSFATTSAPVPPVRSISRAA